MDRHHDLPLFHWTPPTAEVVPFPCARRVGKIRRTAELITGTTDRGAAAYWTRAVSDLSSQMRRAGVAEDRIDLELASFHEGVEAEIRRQTFGGRRARPNGDAA